MNTPSAKALLLTAALLALAMPHPASAAEILSVGGNGASVTTPPSVDSGVANGVVKPGGAPSVSNGTSNGIVKRPGSPSVDNGVANGSAKSLSVEQQTQ
jgi:hypothetical protein